MCLNMDRFKSSSRLKKVSGDSMSSSQSSVSLASCSNTSISDTEYPSSRRSSRSFSYFLPWTIRRKEVTCFFAILLTMIFCSVDSIMGILKNSGLKIEAFSFIDVLNVELVPFVELLLLRTYIPGILYLSPDIPPLLSFFNSHVVREYHWYFLLLHVH